MERRYRETDSSWCARGVRALPEQPGPLRHLRGLPAQARGARGEDRPRRRRPGRAPATSARSCRCRFARRMNGASGVPGPAEQAEERDRPRDPEGNPGAAGLSQQRRPRIPHPCRATPARSSGGESQRIRLASQIGSGLTGVLYVLDEPSIGLHQRDNGRLLTTLKNLRDHGQHRDRRRARRGGDPARRITSSTWGRARACMAGRWWPRASPPTFAADPASLTGQYLSGAREIPVSPDRRQGNRQVGDRGQGHRQQPQGGHRRVPAGPLSSA